MYLSQLASQAANTLFGSRVFLYEVLIRPHQEEPNPINYSIRPSTRVFIKVPYSRMHRQMQRITSTGGKIVSIQPLTASTEVKFKTNSELPWWIEISTVQPWCIYYFGPFNSVEEAQSSQSGYVEDLQEEGSKGISVQIKQCTPTLLTVF